MCSGFKGILMHSNACERPQNTVFHKHLAQTMAQQVQSGLTADHMTVLVYMNNPKVHLMTSCIYILF